MLELGYEVESIPVSDKQQKKEADFIIKYGEKKAILEAKIKVDSEEISNDKQAKLDAGQVSIVPGKFGRSEPLSGILKIATKQLRSSSDKAHDFKMVSFLAVGSNAATKAQQFKDTLYGSTNIVDISNNTMKTCFFYRHSDFWRRQIIDAAIVGYNQGDFSFTYLALNPYSENYDKIKNSDFIEPFSNAVVDPIEIEKSGNGYIPDPEINFKQTKEQKLFPYASPLLRHLKEKYNTGLLLPVDFNAPELSIRVK